MGMLVNPAKKTTQNKVGFKSNVDNDIPQPVSSVIAKFFFFFFIVITLGIFCFYVVSKRNLLRKLQHEINTATSNIDVELIKRRDTLLKLFDATKSAVKFEKSLLTSVTSLRSANKISQNNRSKIDSLSSSALGKLIATIENYPKLESIATINKLMGTSEYIENEIAANRRLYNALVLEFNKAIYVFPTNVIAVHMNLKSMPLLVASDEERKDVKLSIE
ncbi:MAG: LemA family protein [Mycoplasmataceae bacterium]|jgi:LemA protein|nr:LemA family protein [Mycoplasmataceae bacterium]